MKRVVPGIAVLLVLLSVVAGPASGQGEAAVGGVVRDLHGTPQMGALVELLGPDASVLARAFTDDHGRYLMRQVNPGKYQLRASAAFLIPVLRSNLRLSAGTRAVANVTMTAMYEVGVWFPAERRGHDEPADDWRWTLRSSATRPLLRWTADHDPAGQSLTGEQRARLAAQRRVAVSSGAGEFAEGGARQVISVDRAERSGATGMLRAEVGDPGSGSAAPSVALAAGYERQTALGAQTRMVLGYQSQPELAASGGAGLQAITVATGERLAFGDAVMIDAGTLLSAQRLVASRVSSAPYLRVVVTPSQGFALMYRLAEGRTLQSSDDLDNVESMPALLSDASGRPWMLDGLHQELAFSRKRDRDTLTVAVYQDQLPVDGLQGTGELSPSDMQGLPVVTDLTTGVFHMEAPGYTGRGVSVLWSRMLAPELTASVEGEFGTALARNGSELKLADPAAGLATRSTPAVSASVHGTVERTKTSFHARYRWQSHRTLDAVDAFNADPEEAYFSVFLRQRLWSGRRLQGVDAVLEASNLLEEGYQPMVGPDGRTLFLAQVPRAVQAGLSFNF